MPSIIRDFSGSLNLDVHPLRIPSKDFVDALNITRDTQVNAKDGPVSNIPGNRLVPYTFPTNGTNISIGAYPDRLRNRIIEFTFNSAGYHSITNFDIQSRVRTKILESKTDSAGVDILNFQLLYKVLSCNIIHRDEGDLLLWCDQVNMPGKLNITDFQSGLYTPVPANLIRVQKIPPKDEILPSYTTDATNKVNNLKKKLFQFAYAWGYASGELSTMSPPSKVVPPLTAYSVDTESEPSNNNVILLPLVGGPLDYKFIRIFGRESIGDLFGDWFEIDTLNRIDYNIPPGGTYVYSFLNDAQYISVDPNYTDLLFDYAANLCNAQDIVNGNVLVQAGITDGYAKIKRSEVNVQIFSGYQQTSQNTNAPAHPTIGPPVIGVSGAAYYMYFPVGPSVGSGSVYMIKFTWAVFGGTDLSVDVSYTASGSDTPAMVAAALVAAIAVQAAGKPFVVSVTGGNRVNIQDTQTLPSGYAPSSPTYSAVPQILQSGGTATWRWNTKGRFGLVYVDDFGKSNGVVSFVGSPDDVTDFSVTTLDFNFDFVVGTPLVPTIVASINHLPPSWATNFYWVRTPDNTFFLDYITSEVQSDANYFYFCIEDLTIFKQENSGFIPSYLFQSGDRMRVYAEVTSPTDPVRPFYKIPNTIGDYEVLGTVQRDMTFTGVGDKTQGLFLKIKKPTSAPAYGNKMLIEIYRPALRSSNATQVFYSFGESYPIYTNSTGDRYHTGKNQNQTATQPATFIFQDGNVYYKFRDFYSLNSATGKIDTSNPYSSGIMDANYSDFFASAVNSNGAAWVIEPDAQKLYNPVLIRFSQAYQPGTDINGLNRFFADDFDEYVRDFGDIMRLRARDKVLRVFQKLKIGSVPVLQQIIKDSVGNDVVAQSDKLLNKIQYYSGEYGIGDAPESLSSNNFADYFWDSIRGVCLRLSQNGIEPISIKYNINSFSVSETAIRGFEHKIYGVFDSYTNLYISSFEASGSSAAKTFSWNEARNGFESFLSYVPEMMCCINNLLVTYLNGQAYTHDNANYNTFYGQVYDSYVSPVFNDHVFAKKTWESITEQASSIWDVPDIKTSVNSFGTTPQSSNVVESDFELKEDFYHANLFMDTNTSGGIANGDKLKGSVLIAKIRKTHPTKLEYLNAVEFSYVDSQLNK